MPKKYASLRHQLHRLIPITLCPFLFRIVAQLPLSILRGMVLTLLPKPLCALIIKKTRFPLNDTLHQYFPERIKEIKIASIRHTCLNAFEFPWLWQKRHLSTDYFEVRRGTQFLEKHIGKSPVLLVGCHFGQWEAIPVYLTLRGFKGSCIYKEGRHAWIERLLQCRNQRPPFVSFPNTFQGIKPLVKRLQTNAFTYIMFDQVAKLGSGDWANFFGQQAYTMSLVSKLSTKHGVRTAFAFCQRTPSGFALYFDEMTDSLSGSIQERSQLLNQKLEAEIQKTPEYYVWTYPRFRQPRHQK